MARPRQPEPEPLKTNDFYVAAAGTVAWVVALGVLLLIGLPERHHWWYWVCGAGALIGLFACWYAPRLQRARIEDERRHAELRAAEEHLDDPLAQPVARPEEQQL